ncbi:MAG: DUF4185 domain-containing protein [Pedobacter sp.]|nr:DUF4185 domain-containing protein [Pedobacter sp.]
MKQIKFSVSVAADWTNLFYKSSGWFGGDGIYTIPMNGVESSKSKSKRTLIIFSDTMIGEIKEGKLQPDSKMIHNAVALLDGNYPDPKNLNFYWKKEGLQPQSVFIPKTPNTGAGDYYWLGDGFVNQEVNNSIFIFAYRVKTISDAAFGFEEVGNTLLKIKSGEPIPFKNYEQKDTPFFLDRTESEKGSFGAGIFVNTTMAGASKPDGYLYIYGVLGQAKKLLVARVKPKDFEDYSTWTYWDGNNWNPKITTAAPVTDQVSNELSVSELPDGRYALIFQQSGLGRNVCMRLGETPFGPFGPVINIWDTSEALELKGFYSYNAKAHPSLSAKGELLISYNVNSFNFFEDLKTYPNLYRPRFIKVKFE